MRQQLQKRLTEEFVLRGTPLNTRLTYQRCIDRFERHFAASAATLGRAEVRQFLLHLVEHEKLNPSTHNVYAAALYFLYANVLGRRRVVEKLPRRKRTRKLPVVLTPVEVERLLGVLPPRHRAVLMLAYGAGLRISEACQLQIADVDSKTGVIHVRNTKRNRDRDVMLSPRLLAELRSYWRRRRPPGPELFPGRAGAGTTLTRAAVCKALKNARAAAGLAGRRVTPHSMSSSSESFVARLGGGAIVCPRSPANAVQPAPGSGCATRTSSSVTNLRVSPIATLANFAPPCPTFGPATVAPSFFPHSRQKRPAAAAHRLRPTGRFRNCASPPSRQEPPGRSSAIAYYFLLLMSPLGRAFGVPGLRRWHLGERRPSLRRWAVTADSSSE